MGFGKATHLVNGEPVRWVTLFLMALFVLIGACTSAGQEARSAWGQTERLCHGRIRYCLDQCSAGVDQACQVLAVYQVEQDPDYMKANPDYTGLQSQSRGELKRVGGILETACQETKLSRPCDALDRIYAAWKQPVDSESKLLQQIEALEDTLKEAEDLLRKGSIRGSDARGVEDLISEAKRVASNVLAVAKAGFGRPGSGREQIPPDVEAMFLSEITAAQPLANQAVKEAKALAAAHALGEQLANRRASESRREKAEVSGLVAACDADITECERRCEADPDSNACTIVAFNLYHGSGRGHREEAKATLAALCGSGKQFACLALRSLTDKEQAEKDLPKLFAQCERNKAQVVRLKAQGNAAARAGNMQAAAASRDALLELEPKWAETLDRLREAISLVTGDDGPRFRELIRQVQTRCSL